MTGLGKVRIVSMVWLLGMAFAVCFAQQDQSGPDKQPKGEPETPATAGTSPPAQTTPPATANPEEPKASGRASHPQGASQGTKTRPNKNKKTTTTESGKVVVSNGGAKEHDDQLAPAMSKEQQIRERENTNQLLATTDANLKSIAGRQLTPAQQNMLDQIRTYVNQSKAASDAGDLARANTLASKAHLLSDELVKK